MVKAIAEASEKLCAGLGDLGFDFQWQEAKTSASRYIFVTKPEPMKVRVSNHCQKFRKHGAITKVPTIDVSTNGSGLWWWEALNAITDKLGRAPLPEATQAAIRHKRAHRK